MTISVIIPTLNEAENLAILLPYLKQYSQNHIKEIIVVDGGSSDETMKVALAEKVVVQVSLQKGRAIQMNYGANIATGDILYFVHADTLPPKSFVSDILVSVRNDFPVGCFRFRFNSDKMLLKINAYFTRFDRIICRGGDQTLFVTKALFDKIGGYKNDFIIMEDFDFILRVQKVARFKIIPRNAIVSARKYDKNNYFKVNLANLIVFSLYFLGCSQQKMKNFYEKILQYP